MGTAAELSSRETKEKKAAPALARDFYIITLKLMQIPQLQNLNYT